MSKFYKEIQGQSLFLKKPMLIICEFYYSNLVNHSKFHASKATCI